MTLISTLEDHEKIGGYHMITISDELGYHINSTDTLGKVGKEAIGLKGWVTSQDDILCQNKGMKGIVHRSKPFSQFSREFSSVPQNSSDSGSRTVQFITAQV